jgi:hypothetical protein
MRLKNKSIIKTLSHIVCHLFKFVNNLSECTINIQKKFINIQKTSGFGLSQ